MFGLTGYLPRKHGGWTFILEVVIETKYIVHIVFKLVSVADADYFERWGSECRYEADIMLLCFCIASDELQQFGNTHKID